MQEDHDLGFRAQGVSVVLPGLLSLERLQGLLNLGLDLVEGLVKLILDRQIIALDFGIVGLGDLGINFLLQFLRRNAPPLGFGFHELLSDHVLEGAVLDLVFLILEL